jgi:vacuolar-type H+-ATPase subunit H
MTDSTAAAAAAEQVASILEAAERTAERLRADAEQRVRDRIAEGERGAANRVNAAEEEAREILESARKEAARLRAEAEAEAERQISKATTEGLVIVSDAEQAAERIRKEAALKADELLREARFISDQVQSEGGLTVANLRELGSSLRTNAERLMRDIQAIHSRLRAELERVEPSARPRPRTSGSEESEAGSAAEPGLQTDPAAAADRDLQRARRAARPPAEQFDVPEFLPGGKE